MAQTSARSTPWVAASIGGLLILALLAALIGLVWIPSAQRDTRISGLWNAICSAAGLVQPWRPARQPTAPVVQPSEVIVTATMMQPADSLSIGRGATLAMQCTMCHGARGMSRADSPNLAGQYEEAIYKQLRDFKSGHRRSAVMAPLVQNLGDQDMRDLAAYYAYLPREAPETPAAVPERPAIVTSGAPMRNIAACESCHGGIDHKPGSPRLDGEPEVYVRAQLKAFASGARGNDLYSQMRNVARQMTSEEIDAAARYYSRR
ncbi:MAG TPA: c-type cytochrome [Rhodocyclaceae bacterium]|nr:c-type cytochrome [Rhodocyclaceae bacterium]